VRRLSGTGQVHPDRSADLPDLSRRPGPARRSPQPVAVAVAVAVTVTVTPARSLTPPPARWLAVGVASMIAGLSSTRLTSMTKR